MLAGGNWYLEWRVIQKAGPEAEELGFWAALIPDHYMWTDKQGSMSLEAWVVLTYLAAQTRTIRLGTLVTSIPFRPPAILAKMVSTLDVISGGRTILGVGAGWLRTEFEAYSKWSIARVRVGQTQEGLELILSLWSKPSVSFHGRYYRARDAILEPKPPPEAASAATLRRGRPTYASNGWKIRRHLFHSPLDRPQLHKSPGSG